MEQSRRRPGRVTGIGARQGHCCVGLPCSGGVRQLQGDLRGQGRGQRSGRPQLDDVQAVHIERMALRDVLDAASVSEACCSSQTRPSSFSFLLGRARVLYSSPALFESPQSDCSRLRAKSFAYAVSA